MRCFTALCEVLSHCLLKGGLGMLPQGRMECCGVDLRGPSSEHSPYGGLPPGGGDIS